MTDIVLGNKYLFKTSKTRGRPFVGTVTKKAGIFTYLENSKGETVRVATKLVGREYTFKPYNTAKRQAAEA